MTDEWLEAERREFEEKAFAQRYLRSIRRVSDSNINGLAPVGCPTKAEFTKRNADGSYVDETLDAGWFFWLARARKVPVQQAEPVDEKAEFAAFGDWAMNDPTLPQAIGRLDGRDAGWRAWLARARKAAPLLPLPAAPDTVQVPREPTPEMETAFFNAQSADDRAQSLMWDERFKDGTAGARYSWLAGYRAMIAAAPKE